MTIGKVIRSTGAPNTRHSDKEDARKLHKQINDYFVRKGLEDVYERDVGIKPLIDDFGRKGT